MPQPELPLSGSCRCGAVTIEITAAPIMTAACHCRGCQKMSASAFSVTALIPTEGFRVTAGTPVKGGAKGTQLDHMCCPACFTWMFTRIHGVSEFVNVRPTMFDDAEWAAPFIETVTKEKLSWAVTPARHSYEGFPPPAEYPALLAEYAARG